MDGVAVLAGGEALRPEKVGGDVAHVRLREGRHEGTLKEEETVKMLMDTSSSKIGKKRTTRWFFITSSSMVHGITLEHKGTSVFFNLHRRLCD